VSSGQGCEGAGAGQGTRRAGGQGCERARVADRWGRGGTGTAMMGVARGVGACQPPAIARGAE